MITSEHFTLDLPTLLAPSKQGHSSSNTGRTLILKASILLGRIVNYHNELHHRSDDKGRLDRFAELENALARICLLAPQTDRPSLDVHSLEFDLTIWLQFLLHTCTILLYHPVSGPVGKTRSQEEPSGFVQCVSATSRALRTIKSSASISIQPLTNPFLMPTYFLCCRFLAISWLETGKQALRDDIDLILLIIDRVGDIHHGLANKYRTSILTDLARSSAEAKEMRVGTGSYLGYGCHKGAAATDG